MGVRAKRGGLGPEPVADVASAPAEKTVEPEAPAVFLTPEELSRRWRLVVMPRTLRNWRAMRRGPAWRQIGNRVLYALVDVEAFEAERDGQFLRR